jgi:hypothetical protein
MKHSSAVKLNIPSLNLSLCSHEAMWVSGRIAPIILNFTANECERSGSCLGRCTSVDGVPSAL